MESPVCLPAPLVLQHWTPAPWQITGETVEVIASGPVLPVARAAVEVDGDELVCGDQLVPDLTLEQTAAVRRTAQAINGLPRGQLLGVLLLIGAVRSDVLQDALEGLGWPVPEGEDPWIPDPLPGRRRRPSAASAVSADAAEPEPEPAPEPEPEPKPAPSGESGESADPRPARASILAVVDSLSADPAGAIELLEAERQAIGSDALARSLGLPTTQALNAVCRRLRALLPVEPEPVEVPLPATVLQVEAVAPAVEVVPLPVDPAAERRRRCREAQAKRRAGIAVRRAEVMERFSDPGRRRWLLRQVVALVEAGQDPAVVFGQQTGLPVADAGRVLRELGVKVG